MSPTFVLIHGGGSTARFWDRLLPHLDGRALAVDLPGRNGKPADLGTLTVDDEVTSVLADLAAAAIDGPVIVVAHSSGGLVVPGVVAGLGDRVRHVVLNASLVPTEGGCGIDCMQPHHREGLLAVLDAAKADGTVITLPPPAPSDTERFRTTYGGDPLDDDALAYIVDPVRCVEDTVHHYFQPVRWSTVAGTPITYVLNERDRPVRPEMQEEMAARLPAPTTVVRVDAGHIPAVTQPADFARLLAEVAAG